MIDPIINPLFTTSLSLGKDVVNMLRLSWGCKAMPKNMNSDWLTRFTVASALIGENKCAVQVYNDWTTV